jgi:hypothetical protein
MNESMEVNQKKKEISSGREELENLKYKRK